MNDTPAPIIDVDAIEREYIRCGATYRSGWASQYAPELIAEIRRLRSLQAPSEGWSDSNPIDTHERGRRHGVKQAVHYFHTRAHQMNCQSARAAMFMVADEAGRLNKRGELPALPSIQAGRE